MTVDYRLRFQPSDPMTNARLPKCRLLLCAAFIGLSACASLPDAVSELPWRDLRGDRGAGVLARDYEMCARLVEQRRGLMGACLEARGWVTE